MCCPDPRSLLRPPPTSSRPPATSRVTGYRQDRYPLPQDGAEEDLSSSKDNPLTIPRPLRREVPRHRLQDQRCRPWPSPLGNRLGSSLSANGGPAVTTLQASLHVADWSVAPPRFAPHLSMTHGGLATGDLGVSPDRTRTGWLPSACRSVTSQQPPCRHGAQAAGRTPISAAGIMPATDRVLASWKCQPPARDREQMARDRTPRRWRRWRWTRSRLGARVIDRGHDAVRRSSEPTSERYSVPAFGVESCPPREPTPAASKHP